MFGKPGWFRERRRGWGLTPIRWQGWVHSAFWGVAILLPFLVLLGSRGAFEALIWAVAGFAALVIEVRQLKRAKGNMCQPLLLQPWARGNEGAGPRT